MACRWLWIASCLQLCIANLHSDHDRDGLHQALVVWHAYQVFRFAMQVGVSMVLSFMVVWDLPMIANGVKSLETSRLAPIYAEVAPSLMVFGELFGRALQAQVSPLLSHTSSCLYDTTSLLWTTAK